MRHLRPCIVQYIYYCRKILQCDHSLGFLLSSARLLSPVSSIVIVLPLLTFIAYTIYSLSPVSSIVIVIPLLAFIYAPFTGSE